MSSPSGSTTLSDPDLHRKRLTTGLYLAGLAGLLIPAALALWGRWWLPPLFGDFLVAQVLAGLLFVQIGHRVVLWRRQEGIPGLAYWTWLEKHLMFFVVQLAVAAAVTLPAFQLAEGNPWITLAILVSIALVATRTIKHQLH